MTGAFRVHGTRIEWGAKDKFTAPAFGAIDAVADENGFVIRIHDRPLKEKIGDYEERAR